jgi:aminoglycoside phosphotransferase (APT) family kinase protein
MAAASNLPDAKLAATIATRVTGYTPAFVRRFTTGARHYVFDVAFAERAPIVVRIGDASARAELAGGLYLYGLLRARGAPLPAILADDVDAPFPWMAMERLPGEDLAGVIAGLSQAQRDAIAAEVARVQAIAATTASAGRYGYAVRPDEAPHAAWSGVLAANLARSRARIAAAGMFDASLVERVEARLAALRDAIDAVPVTPFLHDTTTRNVIVAPDGAFSGIVDVDDLCFGDPRYPAALTLAALMAHGGPVDYVACWMRHAGHADDRLFQLYVALFLLDLMGEHGHAFNGNEAPSTAEARAVLLRAFEETLAAVG